MKAYTSPSLDVFCTQTDKYCADILSSTDDRNSVGFGSNFVSVEDTLDD